MAPIRSRRTSLRARALKASSTNSQSNPPEHQPSPTSSLKRKRDPDGDPSAADTRLSKCDKRTLKHAALLSRVRASGIQKTSSSHAVAGPRRRRPGKKLKTELSSLASALPEIEADDEPAGSEDDGWEGISDEDAQDTRPGRGDGDGGGGRRRKRGRGPAEGKMVMKSLRHRPGAMKRKRRMEGAEMERFGRNLAQMAAGAPGDAQKERWEALRGFIGMTMRRDKAFVGR